MLELAWGGPVSKGVTSSSLVKFIVVCTGICHVQALYLAMFIDVPKWLHYLEHFIAKHQEAR